MKMTAIQVRRPFLTGLVALMPVFFGVAAEPAATSTESNAAPTAAPAAPVITAAPAPAPVKLPYGVDDVLKLSRAQISEDVILNYVQGSGTIYNLSPKDIVYLRDQGVSEKVINTMLEQRKRAEIATQAVPAPVPSSVSAVPNAPSVPDAPTVAAAPTYSDPNATYATAPLTPPASSVYVIPYPAASYAYYGSYGYPYYYGGWYGPSVSIGLGFGGYGRFYGHHYGGHGFYGGHGGHFGGGSFAHGGHR